jgi:hypothetical protein
MAAMAVAKKAKPRARAVHGWINVLNLVQTIVRVTDLNRVQTIALKRA